MQPTRTKTVLENTTAKKKKRKKTEHKKHKKRKNGKDSRNKMQIQGEELLGPQASLREFSNTGLGGRVRKFVLLRVQSCVSGQEYIQ